MGVAVAVAIVTVSQAGFGFQCIQAAFRNQVGAWGQCWCSFYAACAALLRSIRRLSERVPQIQFVEKIAPECVSLVSLWFFPGMERLSPVISISLVPETECDLLSTLSPMCPVKSEALAMLFGCCFQQSLRVSLNLSDATNL